MAAKPVHQLLAEIDEMVESRHIKHHPLVADIRSGRATRAAIAGIAFIEGASARRNDIIIEGLVEHYGFERGADDLLFWELHASEIEEGHGDIGPLVVARYANDEHTQREVIEAVITSIDLQWLAFDGIHRAFVLEDPAYDRWR